MSTFVPSKIVPPLRKVSRAQRLINAAAPEVVQEAFESIERGKKRDIRPRTTRLQAQSVRREFEEYFNGLGWVSSPWLEPEKSLPLYINVYVNKIGQPNDRTQKYIKYTTVKKLLYSLVEETRYQTRIRGGKNNITKDLLDGLDVQLIDLRETLELSKETRAKTYLTLSDLLILSRDTLLHSQNVEFAIQNVLVWTLCFFGGFRSGCFLEASKPDEWSKEIRTSVWDNVELLSEKKQEKLFWTSNWTFKWFKGWNENGGQKKTFHFEPTRAGIVQCPTILLIMLGLHRGVFDDGIETINDIIETNRVKLRVKEEFKNMPIFQAANIGTGTILGKPQSVISACQYLSRQLAKNKYPPGFTLYSFRYEAAERIQKQYGTELARVMLNHEQGSRVTERHYLELTKSVNLVDTTGAGLGNDDIFSIDRITSQIVTMLEKIPEDAMKAALKDFLEMDDDYAELLQRQDKKELANCVKRAKAYVALSLREQMFETGKEKLLSDRASLEKVRDVIKNINLDNIRDTLADIQIDLSMDSRQEAQTNNSSGLVRIDINACITETEEPTQAKLEFLSNLFKQRDIAEAERKKRIHLCNLCKLDEFSDFNDTNREVNRAYNIRAHIASIVHNDRLNVVSRYIEKYKDANSVPCPWCQKKVTTTARKLLVTHMQDQCKKVCMTTYEYLFGSTSGAVSERQPVLTDVSILNAWLDESVDIQMQLLKFAFVNYAHQLAQNPIPTNYKFLTTTQKEEVLVLKEAIKEELSGTNKYSLSIEDYNKNNGRGKNKAPETREQQRLRRDVIEKWQKDSKTNKIFVQSPELAESCFDASMQRLLENFRRPKKSKASDMGEKNQQPATKRTKKSIDVVDDEDDQEAEITIAKSTPKTASNAKKYQSRKSKASDVGKNTKQPVTKRTKKPTKGIDDDGEITPDEGPHEEGNISQRTRKRGKETQTNTRADDKENFPHEDLSMLDPEDWSDDDYHQNQPMFDPADWSDDDYHQN